jgi:peptidoglycan hydrolase-like protein with peptidoglycan-binding domain
MNIAKYTATTLGVTVALAATPVFAQTYYPNYYGTAETASCTILTSNLSFSSRGEEVKTLQRFLVAQNYPGGGTWMITGYYGQATTQAVRNFQMQSGLSITGSVNAATRSAIQINSCGGTYGYQYDYTYNTYPYTTHPSTYTYSYPYSTTPYYYTGCQYYNYHNCQPQSDNVFITYLTPNSGAVGTDVTVYGYGFGAEGNTVHFGNGIIANLRSLDGRALSFKVPNQIAGYGVQPIQLTTYNVYVTNRDGQNSNTKQFTVTALAHTGLKPTVTSISGPNSMNTGTQGTWTITVNAPSNSYVTMNASWGDENFYNYTAQQSTQSLYVSGSQTFTFTHTYNYTGTYNPTFTVSNTAGSNVSSASVHVTGSGTPGSGQTALNSLSPTQGQKGTLIVLTGSGFSATDNTVRFGIGGSRNIPSVGGTVIYYTVPHYVSVCDLIVGPCASPVTQITNGTYPVYVTNSSGTTQTHNFSVVQ